MSFIEVLTGDYDSLFHRAVLNEDLRGIKKYGPKAKDFVKRDLLKFSVGLCRFHVIKALIEIGIEINDPYFPDILFHATNVSPKGYEENMLPIVKLLFDNGADVNRAGNNENCPIHNAASLGMIDVVLFLLENNADPNRRGSGGKSTLECAFIQGGTKTLEITKALIKYNVDVNARGFLGNPIIHNLIDSGASYNIDAFQFLLDNGMNIHATDTKGVSAIDKSKQYPFKEITDLIQDRIDNISI